MLSGYILALDSHIQNAGQAENYPGKVIVPLSGGELVYEDTVAFLDPPTWITQVAT